MLAPTTTGSFASLAVALLVALGGHSAHAAPPACRVDLKYTSTAMTCGSSLLNCEFQDDCTEGACDLDVEGGKCLLGEESLFCCAGCKCPTFGGEDGSCLPVGDNGVCLYPEHFDYCSFAPSIAEVEACYTSPGGARTRDYGQGDCDGDGISNQDDPEVCPPGTSTVPDAGVPDAGTADADASTGGGGDDDSTPPQTDAGTGSSAGPGREPGGGCVVTSRPPRSIFALLLAVAIAGCRRRRR